MSAAETQPTRPASTGGEVQLPNSVEVAREDRVPPMPSGSDIVAVIATLKALADEPRPGLSRASARWTAERYRQHAATVEALALIAADAARRAQGGE